MSVAQYIEFDMISVLRRSVLLKRVGVLAAGVALGQIITIITYPYITRNFSTDIIGVFGIFSTVALFIGNVSCLRYDLAITLSNSRQAASNALILCAIICLMTATIVGAALFISLRFDIESIQGFDAILITFLIVQILSIGLQLISSQWSNRNERYFAQAVYQIVRAILIAILQISAAIFSLGVIGLVGAQVLGFLGSGFILFIITFRGNLISISRSVSKPRILYVAKKFINLPKYSFSQDVLTGIAQMLPHLAFAYYYGAHTVGIYWLTVRTMQLPMNFFSQSIRQVLLQSFTRKKRAGLKIYKTHLTLTLVILLTSIIILSPIFVFGPEIFGWFFGDGWSEAGLYAPWVSLWIIVSITKIPTWCLMHIMSWQKYQFRFEIAALMIQSVAVLLLPIYYNAVLVVAVFALISCLVNSLMFTWALINIRQNELSA